MLAKYQVAAGASINSILDDFKKILTGTTDKTTLSASCDQANSYILNTYNNAGWAVYDNVSATQQILSALTEDGTQTKLVDLSVSGANITFKIWESWNATTNTGTNASGTATISQTLATAGYVYYIYATQKTIQIFYTNGGTGGWHPMSIEFDRDDWATTQVDSGLVSHGILNGAVSTVLRVATRLTFPRAVNGTGAISSTPTSGYLTAGFNIYDSGASNYMVPVSLASIITNMGDLRSPANLARTAVLPIFTNIYGSSFNPFRGCSVTQHNDCVVVLGGAALDEFTHNAKTYILMPITDGTYGYVAIPKG